MAALIRKNGIALILAVFVFSLFASMASASKLELKELGDRIRNLQEKIDRAYEELRKLNEEGTEQDQEQAQLIMAQIKEMQSEIYELQKNIEVIKNGGGHNGNQNLSDRDRRDDERSRKLSMR